MSQNVLSEIKTLIVSSVAASNQGQFDPVVFLETVANILKKACLEEINLNPVAIPSGDLNGAYSHCATFLSDNGFTWAAEQLIVEWWELIGQAQLTEDRHIYRASTAHIAHSIFSRAGDNGAALRWLLLCQADDLLDGHPDEGGAGRQLLLTRFRMTQAEHNEFKQIANNNLNAFTMQKDQRTRAGLFAEDIIVKAAQRPSLAHFFTTSTAVQEFPVCRPYFTALINCMDGPHKNTKSRGDALEDLAAYLLLLIPGWIPRRNIMNRNQGSETDIVVSNFSSASDGTPDLFGRHFIVECKNTNEPVDVRNVGYFLYRMKLAHCKFGVIFSARDITGKKRGETAARSLIRQAFHEDGITCIVLDRNDIEALAGGAATFLPLLLKSIDVFRFGEPRNKRQKSN